MDNTSDLLDGDDDGIVGENIANLRRKGYPESEATAIALRKARAPRRAAPRTVPGQDIELLESDNAGPAVDTAAQAAFTTSPKPKKADDEGGNFITRTLSKTKKALKGT